MTAGTPIRRLLFVDDEVELLDALRTSLRKERKRWLMHFSSSAAAALAEIERENFDVVITDMRMPDMDGASFLAEVRARRPEIVRFVLSGDADERTCLRALPNAHQWLTKPCERERLVHAVDRACALRDLIQCERLAQLVGSVASMPVLPDLYRRVMDKISDPNSSVFDVAELVRQDPALCGKFLQLVNSSFYGLQRQIVDIGEAVSMIGLRSVNQLLLASEAFQMLAPELAVEGCSFESFQRDALLTSRLAGQLVARQSQAAAAVTAGMLHDIGSLLLLRAVPDLVHACVREARASGTPLAEVEMRIIGTNHAAVGAALLGLWGLPLDVVEAVAFHHSPSSIEGAEPSIAGAVYLASSLIKLGFEELSLPDLVQDRIDTDFLTRIGAVSKLEAWIQMSEALLVTSTADTALDKGNTPGNTL